MQPQDIDQALINFFFAFFFFIYCGFHSIVCFFYLAFTIQQPNTKHTHTHTLSRACFLRKREKLINSSIFRFSSSSFCVCVCVKLLPPGNIIKKKSICQMNTVHFRLFSFHFRNFSLAFSLYCCCCCVFML